MDAISAVASIIAVVQAGGMLFKVGQAFHQTFISKENNNRADDQTGRVNTIEEFLRNIELFEDIKVKTQPGAQSTTPNPTSANGNVPQAANNSGPHLDDLLGKCKDHLKRLRKKSNKMVVPSDASKLRRFIANIKQTMSQSEFAEVDSAIACMLQELNLFISIQILKVSQLSNHRHDVITNLYQTLDKRIQDESKLGTDHHENLLSKVGEVLDGQVKLECQMMAFEKSHEMLLSSFKRLSISSRLERSFSGTTAASEIEPLGSEDTMSPIAPGLIKHPGYGFRGDCLSDPMCDRALLAHINEWLGLEDRTRTLICVQTVSHHDSVHDLCNRVVREITGSGRHLLCYNGLPREGPPPAPGWYTMTHAVWWLSGQLLIPVPHLNGHMPSSGYTPDVEAISERLANRGRGTVYIVLYLLNRSCSTGEDEILYEKLIDRLHDLTQSTGIRLLIFTDDVEDKVANALPQDVIFPYPPEEWNGTSLAEWEVCWSDDDESRDDESEEDAAMSL